MKLAFSFCIMRLFFFLVNATFALMLGDVFRTQPERILAVKILLQLPRAFLMLGKAP